MMAFCRGCGGELPDDPLYAVTQDEAREFSELKVGDYWCMTCFHNVKWPHLQRSDDDDRLPDTSEDDWW